MGQSWDVEMRRDALETVAGQFDDGIVAGDLLDHAGLDWSRVKRTAYLLHQHVGYSYPAPITDLRHRLVVIPALAHGDQRRLAHQVIVSGALAGTREQLDEFGNLVVEVTAGRVARSVEFDAVSVVERTADAGPVRLPGSAAADRRLLEPSRLTEPDALMGKVARSLARGSSHPAALAERISRWVHEELAYEHGVTTVGTTASEALSLGRGVCQDHAHVTLALCRLNGLAARYVSGHLVGEGATHAWVEVLLPDPGREGFVNAVAFDTTQSGQPGLNYVTVAVGRDYYDVAPTSGTYRAGPRGELSARKRLGLTAVEYAAA
jgi:transglutaminase-like putative cysteine protease